MYEQLNDIVKAISVLPFEMAKLTCTEKTVLVQSRLLADDVIGDVVFKGELTKNIKKFKGTFGISNIAMLAGLLNVESFKEPSANIFIKTISKNNEDVPEEIVFENDNFGKAQFRLVAEHAINAKQVNAKTDLDWRIIIKNPEVKKVNDLAQMASIYAGQEKKFSVKTDNNKLKFIIGEENSANHKANFVFSDNVEGRITANHTWPLQAIIGVLKLGLKHKTEIKISYEGIFQIEFTTNVGTYTYMFRGAI